MKTILALLLTCLPLIAQTTYPMLSTTTGRTVVGGVTNLSFLNSNNVFTGTNTFTASALYPANNIGMRLLFTTNIYIPTIAVVAADKTNNADYANVTGLFAVTLPALLSTNSQVCYSITLIRTNVNSVTPVQVFYVGPSTNFLSSAGGGTSPSVGKFVSAPTLILFQNWLSYTNQLQGASAVLINTASNFVDTSSSWQLYMGFYVLGTAYTNHHATYSFYEILTQ